MKITVKFIPNVLSKEGRKVKHFLPERRKVSLKKWLIKSGFDYKGYRVILNGVRVQENKLGRVYLKAGDDVIVTPFVRDPATVFGTFATIATFFGASVTVAVSVGTVAMLAYVVGMVGMIGYSIYSAFQQPKVSNYDGVGTGIDENSKSYTWNGPQTSRGDAIGKPWPVIYGRHAYGGIVLNEYISQDGENSYLNMLLCAGHGPINSISDIKINGNPISNFEGVTVTTRVGTYDQPVIPNFEDLHNLYSIGVQLMKDVAHIYTTINEDVEAFELTFSLPSGLYLQDSGSGAITAWSVTYRVEYKLTTSGTWIDLGTTTISGKSRSEMRRIYRKDGLTAGRYDIRVTRTSADSTLDPVANGDLALYLIDEIQTDDLIYPNKALLAIRALATNQLSGSANVVFIEEGRLVSVPDIRYGDDPVEWEDYYWDPDTEEYKLFENDMVLTWDGVTFVDLWSANPVWCMKDLIVNNIFGLGDLINSENIPDAEYLAMSRACEKKVPDGAGGWEKLYRLDVVLDTSVKAMQLLGQLASAFDAFTFASQDFVRIKIDQDEEPVQIFGMGNTYPGTLNMSWKSIKEVYNLIDVQYVDKEKNYELETVGVPKDDALAVEPLRRSSLRCYTTKQSYALRGGRRALNVGRHINRLFSFKAGIDSIACSPGDIIGFSHDTPAIGLSGVLEAGSTTISIKLDQEVPIEAGSTYKLLIRMPDDSLEERTVTNVPGVTDTITVSVAFSSAPLAFSRYAFGKDQIYYKKLRVFSFQIDKDFDVTVLCSEVNTGVYDYSAVVIPETNYSMLSREIPDVESLNVTEMVIKAGDGTIINTIEVWFRKPVMAGYRLNQYRQAKIFLSDDAGASWAHAGNTDLDHFVIKEGIETGKTYKLAVASVAQNGMENAIVNSPQASITILGKAAKPSNVTGFDVQQHGDRLIFNHNGIPDGDLSKYIYKLGGDWASGTIIGERVDSTVFEYPVGIIGEQTFMVKAIDTSENESLLPAYDTIVIVPPPDGNFALQLDPWSKNREYELTNVDRVQMNLFDPQYTRDVFVLRSTTPLSALEGDDIDTIDLGAHQVEAAGRIEQKQAFDLGFLMEFNLIVSLSMKNVAGGTIAVEVSTSEDGITYTAYAAVDANKTYRARYVKPAYVLETSDQDHQLYFYAATIYVATSTAKKFPFRDVAVTATSLPGTYIKFRDDFTQTPRLIGQLAIANGVLGIPKIESIDADGMYIRVYDPVGAAYIDTAEVSGEVVG